MCKNFQYADETTFFSHARLSNFSGAIDDMSRTLDRLRGYSRESDLAVNATKAKWCRFLVLRCLLIIL